MAKTDISTLSTILDPLRILKVLNEDQYEQMIGQWQSYYLNTKYTRVQNLGGPGDKGRDVLCSDSNENQYFYQCKHYEGKLTKGDVFPEIAKCCYNCYIGTYPVPKAYYFISPHGVTPLVSDLIAHPNGLKEQIRLNWPNMCQSKVTASEQIRLEAEFLAYFERFDFSIFHYVTPQEFLDDFSKTPYYTTWFGRICKTRELVEQAPEKVAENELTYITKILDAYADYLGTSISDYTKLKELNPELWDDFNRQRLYFYSAEFLAAYSRETYAPELKSFDVLKEEFYHGIIDTIKEDAQTGFHRLRKVLDIALLLNTSASNPLNSELKPQDRKGICHHLANERADVQWKK